MGRLIKIRKEVLVGEGGEFWWGGEWSNIRDRKRGKDGVMCRRPVEVQGEGLRGVSGWNYWGWGEKREGRKGEENWKVLGQMERNTKKEKKRKRMEEREKTVGGGRGVGVGDGVGGTGVGG